jgi:hypothetical protein
LHGTLPASPPGDRRRIDTIKTRYYRQEALHWGASFGLGFRLFRNSGLDGDTAPRNVERSLNRAANMKS